jgi:hypothetical protein
MKRILSGVVLAAAFFPLLNATAAAPWDEVDLGTANSFAILAGSAITLGGASTTVKGDIGSTTITGPGTVVAPGINHGGDAVTQNAQTDLTTAYNTAAGLARTATLTGLNLGGMTLTPGVYFFDTSAQLTGTLTLNDLGQADAIFVFQIGSTLTTASDSSVFEEENATGTSASNPGISVFWQVGSSATLGTGTAFEGNILAHTAITVNTSATVDGRLLAETAAVTLDDNIITVPPAEVFGGGGGGTGGGTVPDTGSTLLLLGSGMAALLAFRRRFSSLA